jgi:hypothetical protein
VNRTARRLLLVSLVAVAVGAPVPNVGAAEIGVVADITWGSSREDVDREVELMKAVGAEWVRANVNWRYLERDGKGVIDQRTLGEYDYAIDKARAAGLRVLMPISDGVPYWASSDPNKHTDENGQPTWNPYYPPATMTDFANFARFVVKHYKARGVHAYEIWNEPNTSWFWQPGPNAGQYTEMLKAAYLAVKAIYPQATVVLGGLSKGDYAYLEQVYRAGGGPYFDAVAVHPYTFGANPDESREGSGPGQDPNRISPDVFPAIKEIRATMDRFGDSAKQVWITEFGYSTTSQDGGTTPEQQADYLLDAYRYVERLPWVHSLFTYQMRNNPTYHDSDEYEAQFGLTTTGWDVKPSLYVLEAYAAVARARAHPDARPSGRVADAASALGRCVVSLGVAGCGAEHAQS